MSDDKEQRKKFRRAIIDNDIGLVRELLTPIQGSDGNFPIRLAASIGNIEILRILLDSPHFNPSNRLRESILASTCGEGDLDCLRLLLTHPRIDPSLDDNASIRFASSFGFEDIVETLLRDPRVNSADIDNYAIRTACYNGHVETVKLLLQDSRVDPSEAINGTCTNGSTENSSKYMQVIILLLQHPKVEIPTDITNFSDEIKELLAQ